MNVQHYSEKTADFAVNLDLGAIPEGVVKKAKLHILDAIGVALAATKTPWSEAALQVARKQGGPAESRVLGTKYRLPAANAAFVNGVMVHGLDFDDSYIPGQLHPSCFVVPATLAVAEEMKSTGRETLVAAIAAYEISCLLAKASFDESVGRNRFSDQGFHTAGIFSAPGAAVASAKLMGMDARAMANAMGIAGSQSSGVMQTLIEGAWVKVFHPGWGAHGGIIAAQLSQAGFRGPMAILEGERGLFSSFLGAGNYNVEAFDSELGRTWKINDMAFKLYCAAHPTHFYLESALRLQRQHSLKPEDIAEVCCITSPTRVHGYFEPKEDKYSPTNEYMARFSLPYLIAVNLLRGHVGLNSFDEDCLKDKSLHDMASRVTCEVDPGGDLPQNKGHVVIKTRDGRRFENKQTTIPGTPGDPATREQIERKFRFNAAEVLPNERIEAIIDGVNRLERLEHIGQLMDLTGPQGSQ